MTEDLANSLAILMVEDSAQDEALILSTLKREGVAFTARRVMTADAFQAMLEQGSWDVIISDYHLPIFCADEVLDILKNSGLDIPCVVVSGHIGEDAAIALMKAGASDFVPKNNLSRLAPAIQREIAEARNRREKQAIQQTLANNEKLLADIVAALGEGLVVTDIEGRVLFSNPEAEHLLGWRASELKGQDFHTLVHFLKEDGSPYLKQDCQIARFTRQRTAYRSDNELFVRKDGSRFNAACTATPIIDHEQVIAIIIVFMDVSQRKQADRELRESRRQFRELSNFLQSVREQERTRIARELHDELGQALTALKMDVSWLMRRLSGQPEAVLVKIERMLSLIDSTVDSMRRIAANLRPGQLDDLGLAAAAEWLLDEFQTRTGVRYTLNISHDEFDLDSDLSTTVFRVLQEAITNVARHADASLVDVGLHDYGDRVMLSVADNGKGFDPQTLAGRRKSFGLIGMRERVKSLAGTFEIVSQTGQGAKLSLTIPKTLNQPTE